MSTYSITSEESAAAGSRARLGRPRASRWAPLPVILAGTFMVVLDFFIADVALPSVQSSAAILVSVAALSRFLPTPRAGS
jgi:hypothetical protein